jgi:ATP-dependent exoDNAse (exonuclease V) alpha subunit
MPVKNIFRFLSPHVLTILLVVVLLAAQAYFDLSLPNYTSDLLNVGLQQGGISDAVPNTIRADALQDLEHAWALTVHKSQGSEYRAVILALTDSSRRLLTRTVLYTAVTRARELLIMVGNENIAFRMIDNVAPSRRYNALRIRIREACGK